MEENNKKEVLSSDSSYLKKLQFNPDLRKGWLNFFVSNSRVIFLLIAIITVIGVYSFFTLPRESNPEVKIPIAVVSVLYPGASPSDVEELVTKKVETQISGVKGIDKISSKSLNSLSLVTVEFGAKENVDDAIRRLKDKVTGVVGDLPGEAQEPVVTEISLDDQPIINIVLTGPYDGFTLRNSAEKVKNEVEKISGVREVNIFGGDEKEYEISYNPDKLIFYGISPSQANQVVSATNMALPSGNFEEKKFVYPVKTDSRIAGKNDIENIAVKHGQYGQVVLLKDIADISVKAIDKTTYSRFSVNGSPPQSAVTISIVKRTGGSIIGIADSVKEKTKEAAGNFPKDLEYEFTTDMSRMVRDDFNSLTRDFILTFALVFGILFLIVGLKEALVAGLAIPLVFFVSFASLLSIGQTLNFLSMFSLVLALGLLVDDAIVVVSATKQYLRTGKFTPEEAVLLVLNDFKIVLTTTTLTTVWAFLPLLMSAGIMGEFIKSIPITVSITLISSLLIALMINHPLAAFLERVRFIRPLFFLSEFLLLFFTAILIIIGGIYSYIFSIIFGSLFVWQFFWYQSGGRQSLINNKELMEKEAGDDELIKNKLKSQGNHESGGFDRLIHGVLHLNAFLPTYEKYLRIIISTRKNRIKFLASVFALFVIAVSLPIFGIVQSEFFPNSDYDYVYIDIEAPVGLKLEETDRITKTVEERMLKYKEIENFSTVIGSASAASSEFSISGGSSNIASITLNLKDRSERSLKSYELADKIRDDLGVIKEAKISVSIPKSGPPSGAAFEAQISGDDFKLLDKIAKDLLPELASIPGVINAETSLKESAPEYTFVLDPIKMERNNLNSAYVGAALRMAISGTEVSNVVEGDKEVKIIAKFNESQLKDLKSIQDLEILNTLSQPVFIKDVAKVELKPSIQSITRLDQKRIISITADGDKTTNSNKILADFKNKIRDYKLPDGYAISYGGENEQNTESVVSILQAMVLTFILIFSTLVIQFNSFSKTIIVLVTIPLALIGVFIGLAVFGISLSFPGLIGVLALFGIVVKNAIILVDKMNLNIKSGIPFYDAVIDAGKSRFEAIFITSICTILGILPVTLSNEVWRALGSVVVFGLLLSSLLTLFIIPTLFVSFSKEKARKE